MDWAPLQGAKQTASPPMPCASASGGASAARMRGPLLGMITKALTDADGSLYLLDGRMMQVHVFSPDGQFRRSLSRSGEGPGEVNNATDMPWMPDETHGILQGLPGRIPGRHTPGHLGSPRRPIAGRLVRPQGRRFSGPKFRGLRRTHDPQRRRVQPREDPGRLEPGWFREEPPAHEDRPRPAER